ncbi:MAG: flagellar basal-body MS-ring/collar protein FliF [Candidatus Acidiferrales bacterium]
MDNFLKQLVAFFQGMTIRQKALLAGSTVVVGGIVWVFVRLIGGGDYKPLFVGLAPADVQSLGQKLAAQNINYQISADGASVLVPADQLDKARVGVASQGPITSGRMGFELFDKPNWSGSDFSEKVNYQRALEAELERTIQTMNGVEAVRVHLVLPHESLFTDRERPAKAAVVLKLRGMRMSDQIGASISNLVSSAWDNLSPQNVTVVTTDGQMPGAGHSSFGDAASGSGDLETVMAEKVVQVLTPIVGAEHVKSSVSIEYDPTSGESTQDSYDPASTAVLSSQVSTETSSDAQPSGIPGTATNAPNVQPSGAAGNQTNVENTADGIRTENKTFAVSHTTHHLIEPPGRIKRVAAAILVDDALETKVTDGKSVQTRRKRTPEEMKQIEDLSKAALGWDSSRGDQISVQEVMFQIPEVEAPAPVTLPERVRLVTLKWIELVPVLKTVSAVVQAGEVHVATTRPTLPAGDREIAAQLAEPVRTEGLLPSGSNQGLELPQAMALKQQLAKSVQSDPHDAGRLVQNWIREA